MKNIMILLTVLLITGSIVFAQEKKQSKENKEQVPQAVMDSFAKQYPNIKDVKWEKEGRHWEAEMKQNRASIKKIFDVKGNFMYTETTIQVAELPKEVVEYVAAKYPKVKNYTAGKIIDVNGIVIYEVELKGISHMFFDAKGEYMNRED